MLAKPLLPTGRILAIGDIHGCAYGGALVALDVDRLTIDYVKSVDA